MSAVHYDESVMTIVKAVRNGYQNLATAAANAVNENPRSRVASPQGSRAVTPAFGDPARSQIMAPPPVPLAPREKQKGKGKGKAGTASGDDDKITAASWRAALKRPNVHTGLHYQTIADEYGLALHCSTMIGEDKHRFFKLIVSLISHSNVEKIMLGRENVRFIVRMLLMNAFSNPEPQLTQMIQQLYRDIPSLFESLIPQSEQESLITTATDKVDEGDEADLDEGALLSTNDPAAQINHIRPTVIGCLQPKHCKKVLHLPV